MTASDLRTVLHVDLDAFYAAVEQRDDPALRGRALIVGGDARRGVVLTASYEARRFGVRSAMPMARALRLCPRAIVVPPRMSHYAEVSSQFFAVLHQFSPLVEGLSLDEAFLDVTGEERLLGDGPAIARKIKDRVRAELSLIASVGVAPTKFVAKIASDLGKPDGLVTVAPDGIRAFLDPLPVARLWGVGKVTEAQLARLGLDTVGAVARRGVAALQPTLGADGARRLVALASGEDPRPVVPDRTPVSVGHEDTFARDTYDRAELRVEILAQADRACARVRDLGLRARTVTLKVKYADHERVTRRITLERATADGRVVGPAAQRLLDAVDGIEGRGVRLTGVSLSGLARADGARQLALDEAVVERGEALAATLDRISGRFGRAAVRRAVHVPPGGKTPRRPT
jgi:DNA polymerase-4